MLWIKEGRGRAGVGAAFPWTNVALSYSGLRKLTDDADRLTDAALKQGMHRRSVLLGDPTGADAEGNWRNWVIGRPDQNVDVMLILADDDQDELSAQVDELRRRPPAGLRVLFVQHGRVLPAPLNGREPFGFCDDISQPGVRGRLSETEGDFLTARETPGNFNQGKPGQQLLWPGEFVFGYPGQDALDKLRPGAVVQGGPPWTRNGSLLVFRRLRQDVAGFHAFLHSAATELSRRYPDVLEMTAEQLGAKMVGRWPSGAPVISAPDADRPTIGSDPYVNNDFTFLGPHPTASSDVREPSDDPRGANRPAGDPLGLVCPRAAHIRRAYLRDAATSGLTDANIETHRLLRRAIPFVDGPPPAQERGLLFLAYQTSIERQFEFVTRAWLNNPHLHDTNDGHDPIAGQSFGVRGDRTRTFSMAVRSRAGDLEQVLLTLPADWVVPTGGEYFFVPSISALAGLGFVA